MGRKRKKGIRSYAGKKPKAVKSVFKLVINKTNVGSGSIRRAIRRAEVPSTL